MKTAPLPVMAESTHGTRIRLANGQELIDGIASWWTACHGYNNPHIIAAMHKQLDQMPHVMFGGMAHEPALQLADRLAMLAPGDLNHVFFSDSGSVAVEVALKMAVQYWLNRGENTRTKFIYFRHSYHGDTIGCMAVCDLGDDMYTHFKGFKHFRDRLPKDFMLDVPRDPASTTTLETLISRERDNIAAVIIEPLVQGVGGMKFHDVATLQRIASLCTEHKVLLIADEIFTGFGRTGSLFACKQADIVPDIMCLGKALTGGAITLAATLARKHVFDAFWSDDPGTAFMHGPTYMANPLACAAANASLDLFESEPRLSQVQAIEQLMRKGLEACRALPGVVDIRVMGAIGVVQLDGSPDVNHLRQEFIKRGVWIRPFGDIVYLTPALTISDEDLTILMQAIVDVVGEYGAKSPQAGAGGGN